jgi:hypothetical protein
MQGCACIRNIAITLCLVAMAGNAVADDMDRSPAVAAPAASRSGDTPVDVPASHDVDASTAWEQSVPASGPLPVRMPRLTGNRIHKYLGLGTLALVGLTAVTAPDNEHGQAGSTSGLHPSLGRAAAAMAAAAVTTGLLYHWKDIHTEDGIGDPDNMHALLAGAGALAMLYAVSRAPASGHGSAGILGGVAMGVAVKLAW